MSDRRRRGMVACILVVLGWMELGDCSASEGRDLWRAASPLVAGVCRGVVLQDGDAGR